MKQMTIDDIVIKKEYTRCIDNFYMHEPYFTKHRENIRYNFNRKVKIDVNNKELQSYNFGSNIINEMKKKGFISINVDNETLFNNKYRYIIDNEWILEEAEK